MFKETERQRDEETEPETEREGERCDRKRAWEREGEYMWEKEEVKVGRESEV